MQINTNRINGFGLVGWLVVVTILAAAGVGGYYYYTHREEAAPEYRTAIVTKGDLVQLVTATGQLNPKTNVIVGSQVSGIITRLFVDFNSPVTNNQIVAELDPSTYQAIVSGAKADVANAKAGLELARANADRATALYTNRILSQADFDSTVASLHQSEAQVLQKQAALQQSQVNLDHTIIYAPVSGVVISRNVDVGQTVAASLSAPTLFQIANDLSKMQIDALVSEADIGGIENNQNVNFTVDAFPTRTFQGVVEQIRNSPQTNQNVITYDTVISVDNGELKLRPGMTANVSIITAQRNDVLKIPNAALRFHPSDAPEAKKEEGGTGAGGQASNPGSGSGTGGGRQGGFGGNGGGGEGRGEGRGGQGGGAHGGKKSGERQIHTVYVVNKSDTGKKMTLKPVQIKTGINDGVFTQLLEGLNEGDEIVTGEVIANSAAPAASGGGPFGRRF